MSKVILQVKYLVDSPIFEKDKWMKWKSYPNKNAALKAKQQLERKFTPNLYQFRLLEPTKR